MINFIFKEIKYSRKIFLFCFKAHISNLSEQITAEYKEFWREQIYTSSPLKVSTYKRANPPCSGNSLILSVWLCVPLPAIFSVPQRSGSWPLLLTSLSVPATYTSTATHKPHTTHEYGYSQDSPDACSWSLPRSWRLPVGEGEGFRWGQISTLSFVDFIRGKKYLMILEGIEFGLLHSYPSFPNTAKWLFSPYSYDSEWFWASSKESRHPPR